MNCGEKEENSCRESQSKNFKGEVTNSLAKLPLGNTEGKEEEESI